MAIERLTPERRRELTRNALVDAAAQVFARRGFHGASLDEIAETAGFTRGAIYKNFGGKEDLFFAVFDRRIQLQLAAVTETLGEDLGLMALDPAAIASTWQAVLDMDPDRYALGLEFMLYAIRNPDVRERLAEHQRAERKTIAEFIDQQVASSGLTLQVPAETLAGIMMAASEGVVRLAHLDPADLGIYEEFLKVVLPAVVDEPKKR